MADQAYERGLEMREETLMAMGIRELIIRAMPHCGIAAARDGLGHSAAVLDELGVV